MGGEHIVRDHEPAPFYIVRYVPVGGPLHGCCPARGYPYKQVAKRLYISVKTVESHVSAVLRKLQLSSRYELAHWASNRRIV